ncbi:MAG: hypothetical protein K0R25_654 [Rickettsiaceae bacterium]|jgi:tetratricopeptide (TPR) repeat protein|nr:hypothetical protein [Rickettsiaceae bacterium]
MRQKKSKKPSAVARAQGEAYENRANVLSALAQDAIKKSNYSNTIKFCSELISLFEEKKANINRPEELYRHRSLAYKAQKNYLEQIADIDRALKLLDSKNPTYTQTYTQLLLSRFRAYEEIAINDPDKIYGHINEIIKSDGSKLLKLLEGNPEKKATINSIHITLGVTAWDDKDMYECYSHLSKLTEDDSQSCNELILLIAACINILETEEDKVEWGKKVLFYAEQLPNNDFRKGYYDFAKGMSLQYQSPQEAIYYLEQALKDEVNKKCSKLHKTLAKLYNKTNDFEKAAKHLLYAVGKLPPEERENFTLSEYEELTEDVNQSLISKNPSGIGSDKIGQQDISHPSSKPESAENGTEEVSQEDIAKENIEISNATDNPSEVAESATTETSVESSASEAAVEDEEKKDPSPLPSLPQKKMAAKNLVNEQRKKRFEKLIRKFPKLELPSPKENKEVFTWKEEEQKEGAEPSFPSSGSEEINRAWGWGLPKNNTLFVYFDEKSPSIIKLRRENERAYDALKLIINEAHIVPPTGKQGIKLIEIDGQKCWEAKILGKNGEVRIFARVVDSIEVTTEGNPAAKLLVFDDAARALHRNHGR